MGFLQNSIGDLDWDHLSTLEEDAYQDRLDQNLKELYFEARKFYLSGGIITGSEWKELGTDEIIVILYTNLKFMSPGKKYEQTKLVLDRIARGSKLSLLRSVDKSE